VATDAVLRQQRWIGIGDASRLPEPGLRPPARAPEDGVRPQKWPADVIRNGVMMERGVRGSRFGPAHGISIDRLKAPLE